MSKIKVLTACHVCITLIEELGALSSLFQDIAWEGARKGFLGPFST